MPYESFIPGIDSGLQAWLRMREVAREARLKGGDSTCVIKDVPYKYYHNWVESLYRLKPDEIDLFINGEEHILFNYHVPILPPIGILDSSKTPLNISDFASLDGASLEEFYIRILRERASVYLSQLLQEPGFLINRKVGARKRTLLHLACDFGDLDKARLIITAGANVQIRDGRGQTALHLSLHLAEEVQQSAELLRLLLQRRAVINAQDHQGRTALHYTCMLQSLYLTDLLLGEGADLSISDAHNHMPGHYARQVLPQLRASALLLQIHKNLMYSYIDSVHII